MMLGRKRGGLSLPVSPGALLGAIGLAQEQGAAPVRLDLFVDDSLTPALLAYAKEAFRPQGAAAELGFTLNIMSYSDEPVWVDEEAALTVLLADSSVATGRILSEALGSQLLAVVVTAAPARLERITREQGHEIDPRFLVAADEEIEADERFARLFEALGEWIVRRLPDEAFALARALSFVRGPFIASAIQKTALQNAAIAAVFFLPGADMPLLTLNQIKLFLLIAGVYDAGLDRERLAQLALLLASGLGFRALARRLVGLVPVLGWAVRGGVGYTATVAIGKAAQEFFERGGTLKLVAESLTPSVLHGKKV
ncbi:MAG: hypothetical protein LBC23_04950 [Coriobacteriales bacterium]|jgi:uncharacterized protein (DUF697 family)|nr:hypothetical protein [Coriobacteriales bacterium]